MRYTDNEIKVIVAKLQLDQLIVVKRDELNQLLTQLQDLLQALQDINIGVAKNITTLIQDTITKLLPEVIIESADIVDVDKQSSTLDTPLGPLDLDNSTLGKMIKYTARNARNTGKSKSGKKNKMKKDLEVLGYDSGKIEDKKN
jgi:septation ring formation regulator EzrA